MVYDGFVSCGQLSNLVRELIVPRRNVDDASGCGCELPIYGIRFIVVVSFWLGFL